jgi:hypothetical protein
MSLAWGTPGLVEYFRCRNADKNCAKKSLQVHVASTNLFAELEKQEGSSEALWGCSTS